jgi:murein DD-endopeptidase MepM/ murein hydrolase activator NlpD
VSPANEYKKLENRFVENLTKQYRYLTGKIKSGIKRFFAVGNQRFTVMLIPHSEKKIFNFKMSVFALLFIGVLMGGVLVSFVLFSTQFSGLSRLLESRTGSLESSEASLDVIRDEIDQLRKVSNVWETTLKGTVGALGLGEQADRSSTASDSDLSSFFGVEEQEEGIIRELSELQSLSTMLGESVEPLQEISNLISTYNNLLVDIPTLWPVEGGVGRITNMFGPEIHPFTKSWYLHKGLDIAYGRGKNIVAAASGQVIEKKFEALGFGHFIIIRHRYGFYTKYAHLDKVYVKEGDIVTQGQVIGVMGNSGLSTGPHLHFEIRVGSQVRDPLTFLNIKGVRNRTVRPQ